MSTGTIQDVIKTIRKFFERHTVDLTLLADSDLKVGQAVYLSGNNKVEKATLGTHFPVGVVTTPGLDTENVTVATIFQCTLQAQNKNGGALSAGALLKPDGTVTAAGLPGYLAVSDGDYVSAVVLSGGANATEIRVGVLRTPFIKPDPSAS